MKKWKKGGPYGALKTEVVDESGRCVATVFTKQYDSKSGRPEPWSEGEANLQAIIALPDLVELLETLADWLGPLRDQGQQIGNLDMTLVDKARKILDGIERS